MVKGTKGATAKKPTKEADTPRKLCIRCDKVKPLTAFYPNRDWESQAYHDAWCRDCAQHYVANLEDLKKYCAHNNRMFCEEAYQTAVKKAKYALASNAEYISTRVSKKRKDELEAKTTVNQYFTCMNLKPFYRYVDNISDEGSFIPTYANGVVIAENALTDEDRRVEYSKEWCGWFEKWQLDRLNDLFDRYENDFDLRDVNIQDYVRKACKASLNADIAEDKMRRGEITVREYKDTQQIFDSYSLSSGLAASKRKPGDNTGLDNLGKIIYDIEVTGILATRQVVFPPDDVDRIIAEFRHTDVAIGEENGG